jgi:hypothetical protein
MTTLIQDEAHRFSVDAHEGNKDYDARIVAGLSTAVIIVAIAVWAIAAASGVDATNLQLMSVFP